MYRWAATRIAVLGTLLLAGATSLLVPAHARPALQAMKTYTSATNRYSVRYPATWMLATHFPYSGGPSSKLPSRGVVFSTPARADSSKVEAGMVILVTPNRFSGAELSRLEDALITEGVTVVGTIRHTIRPIAGALFRQTTATAKNSGGAEASLYILDARHGGLTYFCLAFTVLHHKNSSRYQTELAGIIASIHVL